MANPVDTMVSTLSPSCIMDIGQKLSGQIGRNYKDLASRLGYKMDDVNKFTLTDVSNPGRVLLETWSLKANTTVEVLRTHLHDMSRDDVVTILDLELQEPVSFFTVVHKPDDSKTVLFKQLIKTFGSKTVRESLEAWPDMRKYPIFQLECTSAQCDNTVLEKRASEFIGRQLSFCCKDGSSIEQQYQDEHLSTPIQCESENTPVSPGNTLHEEQPSLRQNTRPELRIGAPNPVPVDTTPSPSVRNLVSVFEPSQRTSQDATSPEVSHVSFRSSDVLCSSLNIQHRRDAAPNPPASSQDLSREEQLSSDSAETSVKSTFTSGGSESQQSDIDSKAKFTNFYPMHHQYEESLPLYKPQPDDSCTEKEETSATFRKLTLSEEPSMLREASSQDSTSIPLDLNLVSNEGVRGRSPQTFDSDISSVYMETSIIGRDGDEDIPGYHASATNNGEIRKLVKPHIHYNGAYIIRPSREEPADRCISVVHNRSVMNYRVHRIHTGSDYSFFLYEDGPYFRTCGRLLEYYRSHPLSAEDGGPVLFYAIQ